MADLPPDRLTEEISRMSLIFEGRVKAGLDASAGRDMHPISVVIRYSGRKFAPLTVMFHSAQPAKVCLRSDTNSVRRTHQRSVDSAKLLEQRSG